MRRWCLAGLLCAVAAGGALRFHRLGSVPPALYCDEAFQGYEAYCLLRTGADSRGETAPLFFDIFGVGWQEPLYVYLTTLPVFLLGTTEAAARAAAAAAGTLALGAIGALAWAVRGPRAGAAAALLAAASPWAFHFSRIGFQASLLPPLLAAGAALLLRSVRVERPSPVRPGGAAPGASLPWLVGGAAATSLALYTYVAARVLVPLLLAGFAVCFLPALRRGGAPAPAAALAAVLAIGAPVAAFALTPEGRARYDDVGLASRGGGTDAALAFAANYAAYFGPGFLLREGDPNLRHSARGFGMVHAHDLLFAAAGVAAALARRGPFDLFLLWWLLVAPLPAALGADPAHAVRAIGMTPPLYALAGAGAAALTQRGGPLDPARPRGRALLAVIALAAMGSAAAYLRHYFVAYPTYSGPAWQYGLKEAYAEVETLSEGHDSIYVTRVEDFPHVHRLYLFGFPPEEYQKRGFSGTKYLFDEPVFYRGGRVPGRASPIFLLKPDEVPAEGIVARRTISNPDGSPAFVIAW
jgi:hypothetical protein